MIRAGALRHRITIQALSVSHDTYGGVTETWTDFVTVWASVEPVRGQEFYAAQQVQSERVVKVRIRRRTDVTPDMRVMHDGSVYAIEAVLNDNFNTETLLMCRDLSSEQG